MQNPGQVWFRRNAVRKTYCVGAVLAVASVAWIIYFICASASWAAFAVGALWLPLAAVWLFSARQLRHREQLVQALPEAEDDVLDLVVQGRKTEALRLYRALHPEIGLKDSKHVVDAF